MTASQSHKFPTAFHCYKPPHFRVFGCICISPQNRIALVQGKYTGIWSFPKGHLERAETSQQCALREFFEETGQTLETNAKQLGYKKMANGGYFIYEVTQEFSFHPANLEEISQGGWFTFEEISHMNCNIDVNFFKNLCVGKPIYT
jgi:8-oxo-dGTP pyrophosphatase MutT (NUDIX family)